MKLQARNFVVRKPETIDITMFFKKFCIATRTTAKKSAGANVPSALFVYLRPGFRVSLQYCIGQVIVGVPFFFV